MSGFRGGWRSGALGDVCRGKGTAAVGRGQPVALAAEDADEHRCVLPGIGQGTMATDKRGRDWEATFATGNAQSKADVARTVTEHGPGGRPRG